MDYIIPERHNSHSVTELKAHIVFIPKYRGQILNGNVREATAYAINQIYSELNIKPIELSIMPNHIHSAIEYPPYLSISKIMQFVKGKSSYYLRLFHPELKEFYEGGMWARGYYAGSIGNNLETVIQYIKTQGA